MENAARALLIAAGILLVLMILSFGIYTFSYVSKLKSVEVDKIKIEQLQQFNHEYEVYNKKIMYGTDVISVYNKIKDNNERNPSNIISFELGFLDSSEFLDNVYEIKNTDKKFNFYKCTEITYTEGRVSKMKFEEIDMSEVE